MCVYVANSTGVSPLKMPSTDVGETSGRKRSSIDHRLSAWMIIIYKWTINFVILADNRHYSAGFPYLQTNLLTYNLNYTVHHLILSWRNPNKTVEPELFCNLGRDLKHAAVDVAVLSLLLTRITVRIH